MTRTMQKRIGYVGVVVTLAANAVAAGTNVPAFPIVTMLVAMGMLSVFQIADANDSAFVRRNRGLMLMIVAGLAIPASVYLGESALSAETLALPLWFRLAAAICIVVFVVGFVLFGFHRLETSSVRNDNSR